MKANMGSADRIIRIVLAIAIAVLYFTNVISGILATILLVIGGIFFITSQVSFCPAYFPVGLSTIKKKKK